MSMIIHKIAGVILAGGKSSRMGEDKASLRLGGQTLLSHMQALFLRSGIVDIHMSHPHHIPDIFANNGPLGGIHAVLDAVKYQDKPRQCEYLIFVPVDMPAISESHIQQLAFATEDANLVQYEHYKMPFRLRYDDRWLDIANALLCNGKDVSLGAFQRKIPNALFLKSEETATQYFQNINTSNEWQAFHTEYVG